MSGEPPLHSSHQLDSLYDKGYFHGSGSGYSTQGYADEHADWSGLIEGIHNQFARPIRWLDAGCAYGYLLEQAAPLQVEAYGVDISSYALRQLASVRDRLAQAQVDMLPFRESTFDVLSAFDVVEHLPYPNRLLDEIERVLKPAGISLFSTPDPLYFDREEPTHVHERPPSYWINLLQKRGWKTALRFGGNPYECEIMACRQESEVWTSLSRGFVEQQFPVAQSIRIQGDHLQVAPRPPFHDTSLTDPSTLYVLNTSDRPQAITFHIQTPDKQHPHLFVKDLKVRYLSCEENGGTCVHRWEPVPLPPGGHDILFHVSDDPLPFIEIHLEAVPYDTASFLEELSFDHYQRYTFVASLLDTLSAEPLSILDVGGALGYMPLMAVHHEVTVLDRVWEDHPSAIQYDGSTFPFPDQSFDAVVAIDTLEHIPEPEREAFLEECSRLARKAVVVCGPYDDPMVAESEYLLRDFLQHHLQRQDRFLDEHAQYGLPNRNATVQMLRNAGWQVAEYPNGYLPRWLSMQMASFALTDAPEFSLAARKLNALYNRQYYAQDNQPPPYRYSLIATKEEFPALPGAALSQESEPTLSSTWPIANIIVTLSMLGVLREKEQYLQGQGNTLERFLDHLKNLEHDIQEHHHHAANLDALLQNQATQIAELQVHGKNLAHLLEEQKKERDGLQSQFEQLQKHNADLVAHSDNLVEQGSRVEAMLESAQQHAANLETMLREQREHAHNLESMVQEQREHAANLESMLREQREHAHNLETMLREQREHAANLEHLLEQQNRQFNDMLERTGMEPAETVQEGLPHLEAKMRHLMDENKRLQDTLDKTLRMRLYRSFRRLSSTPEEGDVKPE